MTKSERHNKILELIKSESIQTQEELTERLRQCGLGVTQATVSRDIKALKLVKTASTDDNGTRNGYKYAQSLNTEIAGELTEKFRNLLKDVVVKAEYAGNLAVFKTYSGMANAAAAAIDAMHYSSIIGSVAGDDTILCVLKSEEKAKQFSELIGQTISE